MATVCDCCGKVIVDHKHDYYVSINCPGNYRIIQACSEECLRKLLTGNGVDVVVEEHKTEKSKRLSLPDIALGFSTLTLVIVLLVNFIIK